MAEHDYDIDALASEPSADDERDTKVFMDALSMRSGMEFDPDYARSIIGVLKQAAEIVETSRSEQRDKPLSLHVSRQLQAYNRILQRSHDLPHRQKRIVQSDLPLRVIAHRMIKMSDVAPLPLEGGRQLQWVGEVQRANEPHVSEFPRDDLAATRIFIIGGIPVATTVVGVGLLIESAVTTPIQPNPYIALFAFLAGLALLATAIAVLRERRQS